MSKDEKALDPRPLDPRRRAFLSSLPRKLRHELERALTLDGDAARRARAEMIRSSDDDAPPVNDASKRSRE